MPDVRKLKERIGELEAMVAMARPPDPEVWNLAVVMAWQKSQRKIQRKLDKLAVRMRAKKEAAK